MFELSEADILQNVTNHYSKQVYPESHHYIVILNVKQS